MKGRLLGSDFVLLEPLSEGGMGSVWIADQKSTGSRRAIKVMRNELVTDERAQQRFLQEARVSSRIASDHVVQTVAAGVDDGLPWLAMELLEGETLGEWLSKKPYATREETSEVFLELCHALAAAHANGIVHRDLKPENIFLATSRRPGHAFSVKILDFGIAKLVADAQHTTTAAIGTPLWMAPEQTTAGGKITPATDVWALGLIAFRMLVGSPYWNAARARDTNAVALLREIAFEPLEPAATRAHAIDGPPLPDGFDAWFARCVNRTAEDRFANARECHDALQALLGQKVTLPLPSANDLAMAPTAPIAATLTVRPARARPYWPWIAAAVALIGTVAIVLRKKPVVAAAAPSASPSVTAVASAPPVSSYVPVSTPSGWVHKTCPDGMLKVPGGDLKGKPIATFCLDEDEVTVFRYNECVDKGACPKLTNTVQSPVMDQADVAKWSVLCNAEARIASIIRSTASIGLRRRSSVSRRRPASPRRRNGSGPRAVAMKRAAIRGASSRRLRRTRSSSAGRKRRQRSARVGRDAPRRHWAMEARRPLRQRPRMDGRPVGRRTGEARLPRRMLRRAGAEARAR